MTEKEVRRAIGIKNYIIYYMLWLLEIIINSPYTIIRFLLCILLAIITFIQEKLTEFMDNCFYDERILRLNSIKKVSNFVKNMKKKVIEYKKGKEQ